ncbi:2-amino-4-hydroxy-6-hydroxymethyldihydropteridine diphosphokinase [Paracoccus salsus]|uniref:2-amino-4-hydroxy-6- hydroxymethyldihydropteridine diphosphokinase n=1 Tax=Paracoccus salsus TaxID=2911061 RepID=UPI001F1F7A1B|nr:2-amino-4-hydroxy-6-hydroxymethyldihydropteridine diphosphokinase [Paracoccus salsus]MCF3973723.1 2-amino-4-hydroxy-6-hydroxymethyldihydropteridine diphosphokinase [Paracoccus salsus]
MDKLSFGIVALGANLPSADRTAQQALRSAMHILHAEPDISICAVSRVWQTPAHPAGSGPDYANAVVTLQTSLDAAQLLQRLHAIEAGFGRDRRTGRWSARVLDLDLIALDELVLPDAATQRAWVAMSPEYQQVQTPAELILPHPRMQDRGFVLAPLAEIAPGWRHPASGQTAAALLAALEPGKLVGMVPLSARDSGGFP